MMSMARLTVAFMFGVLLVACECTAAPDSIADAGALVYRQDACARWLATHSARGCALDTWECPVDVNGPPLTSQEVSECDADISASEGCALPSCEVSP